MKKQIYDFKEITPEQKEHYQKQIDDLKKEMDRLYSLLGVAFSPDSTDEDEQKLGGGEQVKQEIKELFSKSYSRLKA
ncbi:MAG: hypothetical protein BWY36_00612 [Candidatus Diapherotrites archaeon ADurb.Bin253]|nr:MAG: hypothetical protein BWY36_00612 [Candidatus Diapherotrites archaeon ADurb.Bin253]